MKILCCSVWHSTNDPKTYLCFDKYVVKPLTKSYIDKKKVISEIVWVFNCSKNECMKVIIIRYGKILNKKAVLETETIDGKQEVMEYLERTIKQRTFVDIPCPGKKPVYVSKFVPLAFGKAINEVTQRKRYLNEQDWANKWKEGIFQDKWVPDLIKSEVKISQLVEKKL